MNHTTAAALLVLALSVTACTTSDPTPPGSLGEGAQTEGETAEETAGGEGEGETAEETAGGEGEGDAVCSGLFEGDTALAERAESARELIEAGEPLDMAQYGEITLLKQRLAGLAEESTGDQTELIEALNVPFVEASEAAQSGEAVDAESGEVTLPEIDVEASVEAEHELEAACQG